MASRFIGLNRGQYHNQVVDGASTGTKDVELQINMAKNLTRGEVLMMIEELKMWIQGDNISVSAGADFGSNNG